MRNRRLFDILKNKRFKVIVNNPDEIEPNPFSDNEDMASFVRNRRGLDKVSRSITGSNSGVSGSRYDNMVRDIDDLEVYNTPVIYTPGGVTDMRFPKDSLYLSFTEPSYERNEFNSEDDIDDFDADPAWEFMKSLDDEDEDFDEDQDFDEDFDEEDEENEEEYGHDEEDEPEEKRLEGIVRFVKGAYLMSKKRQPDETYTEVWLYNTGKNYKDEAEIRKAILAGTDIDPTKNFSEDGSQEAVIDTVGNAQFLTLFGLPD